MLSTTRGRRYNHAESTCRATRWVASFRISYSFALSEPLLSRFCCVFWILRCVHNCMLEIGDCTCDRRESACNVYENPCAQDGINSDGDNRQNDDMKQSWLPTIVQLVWSPYHHSIVSTNQCVYVTPALSVMWGCIRMCESLTGNSHSNGWKHIANLSCYSYLANFRRHSRGFQSTYRRWYVLGDDSERCIR